MVGCALELERVLVLRTRAKRNEVQVHHQNLHLRRPRYALMYVVIPLLGVLLMAMPEVDAFFAMHTLLQQHCPQYFLPTLPGVSRFEVWCVVLVAELLNMRRNTAAQQT